MKVIKLNFSSQNQDITTLINKKNVGISDMLKNVIEMHPSKLFNNHIQFLENAKSFGFNL